MKCVFRQINENAFNENAFSSLNELVLKTNGKINCDRGSFNGLSKLTHLEIRDSKIHPIDYIVWEDIASNLSKLIMVSSFCEKSINYLTGFVFWPSLKYLHLENTPALGVLSAHNIYGLKIIAELKLINCGLDAIEETTFHAVSKTLKKLYLDGNRLKTLEDRTFDSLLQAGVEVIQLTENPWQCDYSTKSVQKKFSSHNFDLNPNCTRYVKS